MTRLHDDAAELGVRLDLGLGGHRHEPGAARRRHRDRTGEPQQDVGQLVDADVVSVGERVVPALAQIGVNLDELDGPPPGDLVEDLAPAAGVVLVVPATRRGHGDERRPLAELVEHRRLHEAVASAAEAADDPRPLRAERDAGRPTRAARDELDAALEVIAAGVRLKRRLGRVGEAQPQLGLPRLERHRQPDAARPQQRPVDVEHHQCEPHPQPGRHPGEVDVVREAQHEALPLVQRRPRRHRPAKRHLMLGDDRLGDVDDVLGRRHVSSRPFRRHTIRRAGRARCRSCHQPPCSTRWSVSWRSYR